LILLLVLLRLAPGAEEKRLAVYTPNTNFSIPVVDHEGAEFVSITDLLDPFGQATLRRDGSRWRLRLEIGGKKSEADFTDGTSQAKVRGKKVTLARPFFVENQRGYIPILSAPTLLTQFVAGSANLRENSRRLFVGDVSTTYSAELQKGNPSRLVLHFSTPVNPTVATETGRVRLSFTREPLIVSGSNPQTYQDPGVRSLTFAESNGVAELSVSTSASALVTFSNGGKTITIAASPAAPAQVAQSAPPPTNTSPTPAPTQDTPADSTPAVAAVPKFIVVIDPAHGGEDTGAAFGGGLFEKDVSLAIARRIRNELDQRGIWAVLLRDGDTNLTLDQRAISANISRASVYVSVHAATQGSGVRLYTARFKSPIKIPDHGFLPWDIAQVKYLEQSHNLAASLATELAAKRIAAVPLEAGMRPLRNVAKAAVAVEIAPPDGAVEKLTSVAYQQSVASAIAAGVANARAFVGATR
jgi:N-acetylmuramoyl-L-alanine amidase